jgi:hypothetical protein
VTHPKVKVILWGFYWDKTGFWTLIECEVRPVEWESDLDTWRSQKTFLQIKGHCRFWGSQGHSGEPN